MININSVYSSNIKKVTGKVSFNVGDIVTARVSKVDSEDNVLIKLLDGWQVVGELDGDNKNIDELNGVLKFIVKGEKDGKVVLELIDDKSDSGSSETYDAIDNFIKKNFLKMEKQDYEMLAKMVKKGIPLTKENIKDIKSIMDFIEKSNSNGKYEEEFIKSYLKGSGVEEGSESWNNKFNVLDKFLKNLSKLTKDDILFMVDNGMELTEENISRFDKLVKGNVGIKEGLEKLNLINDELQTIIDSGEYNFQGDKIQENEKLNFKKLDANNFEKNEKAHKETIVNKETYLKELLKNENDKNFNINRNIVGIKKYNDNNIDKNLKKIVNNEDVLNKLLFDGENQLNNAEKNIEGNSQNNFLKENSKLLDKSNNGDSIATLKDNKESIGKDSVNKSSEGDKGKIINNKEGQNIKEDINHSKVLTKKNDSSNNSNLQLNNRDSEQDKISYNNNTEEKVVNTSEKTLNKDLYQGLSKNILENNIKEEIIKQNENIKNTIKAVVDKKGEVDPKLFNKILESMSKDIKDFKVFNTISNEYYYMNFPLKIMENDNDFKLIIKDDRKSGKKVDSKNVKIAVSLTTKNIGIVDGYISINDGNMSLDIKSEKQFIKILEKKSYLLQASLEELNYNVNIAFKEREHSMNLVNCSEFFEDGDIHWINRRA